MIASRSFPQLETEHLLLRATVPSDAEALFRVFADPAVIRYHDLEPPTQPEQMQRLIQRWTDRFKSGQGIRWGIVRQGDRMPIGSCGYSYRTPFRAEIGYELAQAYWRQGIMSEALKAMLQYGFETLDLRRIEAMVMLDNVASAGLLKKLGFVEEGILRQYGFWKGEFHDLRLFARVRQR
ncbi:GNAT family N-acetyltransferase [Phormidium tenue FACHB-886]|nr:GNAT family N-acetyltransferase [Phormidium tenue FACHB-886]